MLRPSLRRASCALLFVVVASGACSNDEEAKPSAVAPPTEDAGAAPDADAAPSDTGAATEGGVILPTGGDLGVIDCGTSGRGTITFPNSSGAPLNWTVTVEPQEFFSVEGVIAGVLPAGQSETFTIRGAAVASKVTPGQVVEGIVRIQTDNPRERTISFPVKFVADGARLELPAVVDFGLVPTAAPATRMNAVIRNTGTWAVSLPIVGLADGPFAVAATEAIELAPGGHVEIPVDFRPNAEGAFRSELAFEVPGPVCGPSTARIAVAGSSWGGVVGVSPGAVDLGTTGCGSSPSQKIITLKNHSLSAVDWSASLLKDTLSRFQASPSSGTLAGGATVAVDVSCPGCASEPPGPTTDTLRFVLGGKTYDVALAHRTTGGYVRALGGSRFVVPDQRLKTTKASDLELVNEGTDAVTVTAGAPSTNEFSAPSLPITIAPQGSVKVPITFTPTALAKRTASIAFSAPTNCGALSVDLEGYGYARGKQFWGDRVQATYYEGSLCVELDDATLFCDPAHLGPKPAGATLLTESLANSRCYREPSTTSPYCYSYGSFSPVADYAGLTQVLPNSAALLDDGTAVVGPYQRTPISGLTDVARLVATDSTTCAILVAGTVECWGYSTLVRNLTPARTDLVADAHAPLPGITDAVDVLLRTFPYYYGYNDIAWVVHKDGRLSVVVSDSSGIRTETVVGITDARELRGIYETNLLRMQSGLVALLTRESPASFSFVPVSNVVDIGASVESYYTHRVHYLRADGRILEASAQTPAVLNFRSGFDR